MIDFEALRKAFAPITEVGRGEETLDVGGHRVTLRTLLPEEDSAVLRVATQVLQENPDGEDKIARHVMMTYWATFQTEVLAHAIVQIDDLDLRGVDWVLTGEKTTAGKSVRVARHVAVRELITKVEPWTTVMKRLAYDTYANLHERTEQQAERLVEWDPSDLQAEIERVTKRLDDLKTSLADRAKGDPNLMVGQIEAVRQYDEANRRAAGRAQPASAKPEPSPPPAAIEPEPVPEPELPPDEGEWADFEDGMPRTADLRDLPQEPVVSHRPEPRQPITPPTSAPPQGAGLQRPVPPTDPLSDVMDSFHDPSDSAALAAEQDRIIMARRQMLMEQQQAARAGAASAVHRPRAAVPPHLRGREPIEEPADLIPAGELDGVPTFRMPTQELSPRGRGRPQGPPEVNRGSDGSRALNPKFKPPGG